MPSPRKTNRRQFLQGRSAAEELLDITNGIGGASTRAPRVPETPGDCLFHLTRAAMACDFEAFFRADESAIALETALQALDLVETLEYQLSVYRDQSELSRLNRRAAAEWVIVEPRLFRLLERAVELYSVTQGAFDITSGPLSKAWGFYRRAGRVPTDDELSEALAVVGSHLLELDKGKSAIRFLKSGVEINLGAIGKGYALDRCAEWFAAAGLENYLLHGGMSSVLARESDLVRRLPPTRRKR